MHSHKKPPKGIDISLREIRNVGPPSLSVTHSDTYNPHHQQVTHTGLSRSALSTPAAVISSSPKVSCAFPRQRSKAKGIDAPIKEKINANSCGDQKAKVNKWKTNELYIHYQVCTLQCPRAPGFSTCAQQCARASSGILQVWLRTALGLDFPPPHCSKLGTIWIVRGHGLSLPPQGRVWLLYILVNYMWSMGTP